MIGDDIVITIVEIRGHRVRIGIEAPKATPVHREELWLSVRDDIAALKESETSPPVPGSLDRT